MRSRRFGSVVGTDRKGLWTVGSLLLVVFSGLGLGWSPLSLVGPSSSSRWTQRPSLPVAVPAPTARPQCCRRRGMVVVLCSQARNDDELSLNELQTALRKAVEAQNFLEAARLRDVVEARMTMTTKEEEGMLTDGGGGWEERKEEEVRSWEGLGVPSWLSDRLDDLGYGIPTAIQLQTLRALGGQRYGFDRTRAAVLVSAATGCGKTLAYLVPLLAELSDDLFRRQKLRTTGYGAEDEIDSSMDKLFAALEASSPTVRGQGRKQVGGGTGGLSGDDKGNRPLALLVVPSRELGVQVAYVLYSLVGGSSSKRSETDMEFDKDKWKAGRNNFLKYRGPKSVKIGCLLDDADVDEGLKLETDVAVTMPKYLPKLLEEGDVDLNVLRYMAVDEADAIFSNKHPWERYPDPTELVPLSVLERVLLVGATLTPRDTDPLFQRGWLPQPNDGNDGARSTYVATETFISPASVSPEFTSSTENAAKTTPVQLPLDSGLVHRRCICRPVPELPPGGYDPRLVALVKMLRRDAARRYNDDDSVRPPRAIVFFPDEPTARAALPLLRDGLWNVYRAGVLLPRTGYQPLDVLESFRLSELDLLVATPDAIRGLDLEDLDRAYALYVPSPDRPEDYLHLAGRVGRLGRSQRGIVTTLLCDDVGTFREYDELRRYDALSNVLGFAYEDVSDTLTYNDNNNINDGDDFDLSAIFQTFDYSQQPNGDYQGNEYNYDDDDDDDNYDNDDDDVPPLEAFDAERARDFLENTITFLDDENDNDQMDGLGGGINGA